MDTMESGALHVTDEKLVRDVACSVILHGL